MNLQRNTQTLVGLGIALIVPPIAAVWHLTARLGFRDAGREVFWWALLGLLIIHVLYIERRPLSSIGARPFTVGVFWAAILVTLLVFVGNVLMSTVLAHVFGPPALHPKGGPLWMVLLIILRAAITEEVFFRGYGVERLLEITESRWLAGGISLLCFAVGHLGGPLPWLGFLTGITAGFGYTILYLWKRNIASVIIAHGLVDALPTVMVLMLR